jgi:hypothetical protein
MYRLLICTFSTERPWNAVWFKEFDQMVAT